MVRTFFCMWRPCRADVGPVGSREAFTPKPNRGDPFRGVGVFPAGASNPSVRPIAEQWHEAALPPKYSRRWGFVYACSIFVLAPMPGG